MIEKKCRKVRKKQSKKRNENKRKRKKRQKVKKQLLKPKFVTNDEARNGGLLFFIKDLRCQKGKKRKIVVKALQNKFLMIKY